MAEDLPGWFNAGLQIIKTTPWSPNVPMRQQLMTFCEPMSTPNISSSRYFIAYMTSFQPEKQKYIYLSRERVSSVLKVPSDFLELMGCPRQVSSLDLSQYVGKRVFVNTSLNSDETTNLIIQPSFFAVLLPPYSRGNNPVARNGPLKQ